MNLNLILTDPELQSSLIPLVLSLVLIGVFRVFSRMKSVDMLTGMAVGLAVFIAMVNISSMPAFPPRSSGQKIVYLVLFASMFGGFLASVNVTEQIKKILAILFWVVSAAWVGWSRITNDVFSIETLTWLIVVVVGGLAFFRLRKETDLPQLSPIVILCAAFGVGGIAMLAQSASIAQNGFVVAAATGGFMLYNWPKNRFDFGWAGLMGTLTALLLLSEQLVLFTRAVSWPLLLLIPVFFVGEFSTRFKIGDEGKSKILSPIIAGIACLLPVVLAVGAYLLVSDTSNPY